MVNKHYLEKMTPIQFYVFRRNIFRRGKISKLNLKAFYLLRNSYNDKKS